MPPVVGAFFLGAAVCGLPLCGAYWQSARHPGYPGNRCRL